MGGARMRESESRRESSTMIEVWRVIDRTYRMMPFS